MIPTRFYFSNAVGSVDFVPDSYVYLHWSGAPLTSLEFRALYEHVRNLWQRHQHFRFGHALRLERGCQKLPLVYQQRGLRLHQPTCRLGANE